MRGRGHGAVGGRDGGHLPLEELEDDGDIRRHTGLQSERSENHEEREVKMK